MRCVSILFSLVLAGHISGMTLDSLRAEQRKEGLFVIHQVDEKETMYSIARRYGSTVKAIIEHNDITENTIDIGQIIDVLVLKKETPAANALASREGYHQVVQGETLYSLSRQYEVSIRDLRTWNELDGNDLTLGMYLRIREDADISADEIDTLSSVSIDSVQAKEEVDPYAGFEKYLVQAGESLTSIASKIGVSLDSIRIWNDLESDYLKIGQPLFFVQPEETTDVALVDRGKGKWTRIDEDGFERTYEEGIASVIESMRTSRYLALHATLPIGTNVEVRNLMNNQVVYVKVVGKLPKTGLNKDLLIRLSKSAYDQLGILDSKARVEVSYYN